jgi:hypothetical protein
MAWAGFHFVIIALLTVLTQLGGLAWLLALAFRRRFFVFVLTYMALSLCAVYTAPLFGRVALSCVSDDALKVRSLLFCALNRHYVVPELRDVLVATANSVENRFPGTQTLVLDAGFPFLRGFPLLPHLSHEDGRKADIAFYYRDATGYLPGKTRSPIGYFAFENGPTSCPSAWFTMRWNAGPLQNLWPDWQLESDRTRFALRTLARDPRVSKVFIEPHLKTRLQVSDGKVRFQGCRAARHDDHIHLQL